MRWSVPKGYVDVALVPSKDAHDTGLGGGIRGSLRHLPLSVHLSAVDRQPERADQQNAHGHHNENDSLSVLGAEMAMERFKIR
jgi:hypothetical protein